jgi:hypothetical protein
VSGNTIPGINRQQQILLLSNSVLTTKYGDEIFVSVRFEGSQWCDCGIRSSEIGCYVSAGGDPNIVKEHSAFIFKG